MTHAELDNGRGYARQKLFRHKHEMESGRTSSVGNDILGFDSRGVIVNKSEHGNLDWVKICEKASKVDVLLLLMLKVTPGSYGLLHCVSIMALRSMAAKKSLFLLKKYLKPSEFYQLGFRIFKKLKQFL